MPNSDFDLDIKSTFFSEITGIAQTASQSFGPVGSTTQEKEENFQVTSLFTATGVKKAYAVCKGRVFIQPQTGDSNKVNLILHPLNQPSNRLQIKYFVYRGLDKSSFIHSTNTSGGDLQLIPNANVATANDLVKGVWAKFKSFNNLADTTTESLLAKWVGYDPTNQIGTNLIDTYLYKISSDDLDDTTNAEKLFELPTIEEGAWIGNFSGDFGLDIVLDYGDYDYAATGFAFNLVYARAAKWGFDITQKPMGIPEKAFRQPVLHFIDPAAFWGMHYSALGKVVVKDNTGAATEKITPYIYDDIVSLFYTKNNIYIAIQSDRGQSYNYYENYNESDTSSNSIKIGMVSVSLTAQTFDTYKWPLIISNVTQTHSNPYNDIFFQLVTDNQPSTVLYCQNGLLETESTNKFITSEQLIADPQDVYTTEVQLSVPATGSTDKYNVASLVRLVYNGKVRYIPEYVTTGDPKIFPIKYLDDIFPIVYSKPFEIPAGELYIEKIPSNTLSLVDLSMAYPNNPGFAVMQTQTVFDYINILDDDEAIPQGRVTFELNTIEFYTKSSLTGDVPTTEVRLGDAEADKFQQSKNNYYLPPKPYEDDIVPINIYPDAIKVLRFNRKFRAQPSKFLIGITTDEYTILTDLIGANSLCFSQLYFEDTSLGSYYISYEGLKYKQFNLMVVADDAQGNTLIYKSEPNIKLLTIDTFMFASTNYSLNLMPQYNDLSDPKSLSESIISSEI